MTVWQKNKKSTRQRPLGLAGLLILLSVLHARAEAQDLHQTLADSIAGFLSLRDSVLRSFSLDELERFRNYYSREITRLQNERLELRKRGIRDGELFLSRKPTGKSGAKVMMRLAELYYEQAQDDFQIEMQEYDRLYGLYERGEQPQPPAEPRKNIGHALDLYLSVVEKYPNSELVDDAFFNIGYLLEEAGYADSSRSFFEKVVQDYPQSPLVPDALMRLGEYYFNPPVNAVETAIHYFERILAFYTSPRYNEALYRLGWCYYRINDYPRAIAFFTRLADDVEKTKRFDPGQKYTNPALVDESVEYIGLSFLDYGGAPRAAQYLQQIGGRDYGVDVLKRIGDAYFTEKEDYPNALQAFTLLLHLYPDAAMAPAVQNRIVQCYRRLEDQTMAFRAREELYSRYRQDTDWWNKNTDKEVRQKALLQVESALRDNITVLLNRGQETQQLEFFRQAVSQSRKYLSSFPADSSAALIHWNLALTLDTKLKETQQAFEEYIKINNLYWDSRYQRNAAANAVALARDVATAEIAAAELAAAQKTVSLADLQKETKSPQGVKFREKMKLEPHQLTAEEERLGQAYDNYIKLFPHDQETPVFLANAGALYYRRHQYKEALKYFNTLIRHFPGSEEFAQARYAIMESYFGKADFRSSEVIARRIVNSDAPEEVKAKAQRRLAESIYLAAELLAEGEKHFDAGNEYRRVVKEAPSSSFADLALFNAALEYDKANEFNRAIETYQNLMTTRPQSPYVLDAQNNLAFDYVEVRDYRNAALTYDRLADLHTDTLKARDALYNAGLYFSKSEDWESAIKADQTFLKRYPNDTLADDAAFNVALFYRRLNEWEKSQEAFSDFISHFPDSPRAVEAHYLRGRHFLDLNQPKVALFEFEKAAAAGQALQAKGLDGNPYFSAEAEFNLAAIKMETFNAIAFRLPSAELAAAKQIKKDLLLEIVRHLSQCAAYGTPRVYEATHLVGVAYQRFAESWAAQELPSMDDNRQIVAQKEITDVSVILAERAAAVFAQATSGLTRLKESYYQNLTNSLADSSMWSAMAAQDTILRIADKWIERSKNSLTEVRFNMGEWRYQSARLILEAPLPKGMTNLQRLVYEKQLLQIGVAPLLQQAFAVHQANLLAADSMHYASPWTDLSKQKLLTIQKTIPTNLNRLSSQALDALADKFVDYAKWIHSGRSLDDQLDLLADFAKDIANLAEFSHALMDSAVDGYGQNLQWAQGARMAEEILADFQDAVMGQIAGWSLRCDSLALQAKKQAASARNRFTQSQDPVYEEGLFTFESNYFALRKMEKEVLLRGYQLAQRLNLSAAGVKNLLVRLVPLDPDQYAGLLDLKVSERVILSDTTWRAASIYVEGWTAIGFDALIWRAAQAADALDRRAIWLFETVTAPANTVPPQVVAVPRLFLRKMFSVQGLPVQAWLRFPADFPASVYLNGELVKHLQPAETKEGLAEVELTDVLINGENVLALEIKSVPNKKPTFTAELHVRQINDWLDKTKAWQISRP